MARKQASKAGTESQATRRWPLLLSAMLLIGGVVSGLWLVRDELTSGALPIRSIQVRTELRHLDAATIRAAVANEAAKGLLAVDVDAIRIALEALPWVERASVRRSWPDQLVLEVVEEQPIARWGERELVNRQGRLFTPDPVTVPRDLPQLTGPKGTNEAVTTTFIELGELLAPLGLTITGAEVSPRRAWRLELNNGLRLSLGRQELAGRMVRFARVYADAIAVRATSIDTVDLRYTNGFAVHWRDGVRADV